MQVQPYLIFEGRCEEALNFYKNTLGAELVALLRYKDAPPDANNSEMCGSMDPEKVMHACVRFGDSIVMASDGMSSGKPKFEGIMLTLSVESPQEAETLFAKVSEGGAIVMPMTKTFFAERFGMATDQFGVLWQVLGAVNEGC